MTRCLSSLRRAFCQRNTFERRAVVTYLRLLADSYPAIDPRRGAIQEAAFFVEVGDHL